MVILVMVMLGSGATAAVSMRAGDARNPKAQGLSGPPSINQTVLRLAAQRAGVNGQSSQIRPLTQDEAQRLAQGLKELVNQSADGLTSVRHPDGTVSMDLQGRFQNVAVARKADDGAVSQACLDNLESAAAFFDIDLHLLRGETKTDSALTNKARVAKSQMPGPGRTKNYK